MISFKQYLQEKRYSVYDSLDLDEGPDGIAAEDEEVGYLTRHTSQGL